MSEPASLLEVLSNIRSQCTSGEASHLSEVDALNEFCTAFQNERAFSKHHLQAHFISLLGVLKSRCLNDDWLVGVVSVEVGHRVLMTTRLLLRDETLLHIFMRGQSAIPSLAKTLARATQLHITMATNEPLSIDILKELTNIFQKIAHSPRYHDNMLSADVHINLCTLLNCNDLRTLHCTLSALINLSKRPESCEKLCSTYTLSHSLLHIISDYDTTSRRLATDLLLLLSQQSLFHSQILNSDGLPILIRLLHSCNEAHILHHAVSVVERLCEASDVRDDVRMGGGIPLLLNLLSRDDQSQSSNTENLDKELALRSAVCSLVAQLVLNDTNAQLVVQLNGMYLVAKNILPLATEEGGDMRLKVNLRKHALRALRYLFSMERHRALFKKLFPPSLFEQFLDLGHYTKDLSAYSSLVDTISQLSEKDCDVIRNNIESTNQNRAPIFSIGGYEVLELLGSGAFGSVYKVRKPQSEGYLALKEIRATHPLLGRSQTERSSALGRLMTEVNMVREHLRHSNVVTYHKCFQEGGHLYIVMQFLEGASLFEHISSLKEKGQKFSEPRLWRIFSQLVLGLRYLHQERRIVHRDLSPANLMLGDGDKLTITDFGLAKQKSREWSVLQSAVGTMLYWCPELVQNEPYNEKADTWAAGCILYQMAALAPPFQANNMLALARKIAEVDYPSLPEDLYSPLVTTVIERCLTADPGLRADTVQLGALLARTLMVELDQLATSNEALQRRLEREKQRSIKHIHKAVWTEQRYLKLLSTASGNHRNDQSNVRRRLSTSFAAVDPDPYHKESPGVGDNDHLRKSTDSVFLEPVVEATNWSPSNQRLSRINPLTSRVRSQSAVVGGPLTSASDHPLLTRRVLSSDSSPLSRQKSRTCSVTSTLSISPRQVREISDPVTALLSPLHKLLTLTHLPPPTSHTAARRLLLDKYRATLFSPSTDPAHLKAELHKLSTGSNDPVMPLVDLDGGKMQSQSVSCALRELCEARDGVEACGLGEGALTYEQLAAVMESLTKERT